MADVSLLGWAMPFGELINASKWGHAREPGPSLKMPLRRRGEDARACNGATGLRLISLTVREKRPDLTCVRLQWKMRYDVRFFFFPLLFFFAPIPCLLVVSRLCVSFANINRSSLLPLPSFLILWSCARVVCVVMNISCGDIISLIICLLSSHPASCCCLAPLAFEWSNLFLKISLSFFSLSLLLVCLSLSSENGGVAEYKERADCD